MTEKLQKVLARLGLGSRRQLDELIAQSRVEVNGKIASVGDRVADDIVVKIDGKVVATPKSIKPKCRVLMYHKQEGEVTTLKDPQDRPTIFDHLPRPDYGRWIYIGRLDINTQGLLLLTTDGDLANRLMHPSSQIERIYAVRVFGEIKDEQIAQLRKGVMLDDGLAKFDSITFKGGEGINRWYHVSLKEGRNREVRRLFEAVDLKVSRLIRIKYGNVELDPKLKKGEFRELSLSEINNLRSLLKLAPLQDHEIAHMDLTTFHERHKHIKRKVVSAQEHRGKRNTSNANRSRSRRGATENAFSKKSNLDGNDKNKRSPYGAHKGGKAKFVSRSSEQDHRKREFAPDTARSDFRDKRALRRKIITKR